MQKFVPIFKLSQIIIFVGVIFSQDYLVKTSDEFEVELDSSLTITPYLESLLSSRHSWGDLYKLTGFKQGNPTKISYDLFHEKMFIDSLLILSHKNVHYRTLNRFFRPLRKVQSLKELNTSVHQLQRSNYFIGSGTNVIIARYSERKLLAMVDPELHFENHFSGILGMSNEKSTMALSGDIQFHFENLWKTAGIIDIRLKRWKAESEKLFLSLEEPFIFHLPFGAKLEYYYEVHEGMYIKTQSSLGILSYGQIFGKWEFTGVNTHIEPTEDGLEKGLNILKEHSLRVSHLIGVQTREWHPKRGLNMNTKMSLGRLSVRDKSYATGELDHQAVLVHSLTIKSGIKHIINFMGRWSSRDSLESSQLIRFGGNDNLRGYRENQFFSEWVVIPSIEVFHYVTDKSILSIFIEGAVQENYRPFPWNYGFSLDQDNSTNHITISFAWGRGQSFSQGKININIVNIL